MYLMIAARRCNIWPRRRVWPLQSCRELLPTASPWLLSDCAGSGRPIYIGPRLSNRPDRLDPCDMAGCQGRVAHHYWAMMTNITGVCKAARMASQRFNQRGAAAQANYVVVLPTMSLLRSLCVRVWLDRCELANSPPGANLKMEQGPRRKLTEVRKRFERLRERLDPR